MDATIIDIGVHVLANRLFLLRVSDILVLQNDLNGEERRREGRIFFNLKSNTIVNITPAITLLHRLGVALLFVYACWLVPLGFRIQEFFI